MSTETVPELPGSPQDAVQTRQQAVTARADLERRSRELAAQQKAAQSELERKRAELEADFQRQADALAAQMAPLKQQLSQMQEVLWTVDLYLGRDESLRLLRDGAPAAADTPITIRQRVLVMAEESLILMGEKATGMDADNIPDFITWLLSDPSHLDRVLPEPKGVVVLIPTRVKSRSGNAIEDSVRDAANQSAFWLLRNGEKVYLLTTDPELKIRDRVLPRRREFTEVFDRRMFGFGGTYGEPMVPGSEEWMAMEKTADARRRHFMRILLVLQGIIDRTPVWHPLPPAGVSLLNLEDQDRGKIILIQDEDPSIQLTDGRESFRDWQRSLNGLLRPGLRIIGNFRCREWAQANDNRKSDHSFEYHHSRLHPESAENPPSNTPLVIEDRRRGGLVVRYERAEQIWKKNVPVPDKPGYVYRGETLTTPSRRASVWLSPSDSFILPMELTTTADIEYYLSSRDNLSAHFLAMVPVLQATLAAKRAEAEAEAPFRDHLTRLLEAEGATGDITGLTDDLVHWWKLAKTWTKPLTGDPAHEGKATREILAEFTARQRSRESADAMVALARREVPGVIAVARDRQDRWHAYAPSPDAHDPGVFLDVTRLRKNGTCGATEIEKILAHRTAAALDVVWSTEQWDRWRFGAHRTHYLTNDERAALIEQVRDNAEGVVLAVTEFHDPATPKVRGMAAYVWTEGEVGSIPATPLGRLDRNAVYRGDSPVTMTAYRVVKDPEGVRLKPGNFTADSSGNTAFPEYFAKFSGNSRWGATPWWPDTAHQFREARPRLVWADEAELDRMANWCRRCHEMAEAERKRSEEIEKEAYRYVRSIEAEILAQLTAAAHARFVEDYGLNAEDLWESHRDSLHLRVPVHPRTIWGVIAQRINRGESPVGLSLGELAQETFERGNKAPGEWHPTRGVQDMKGFEELIVPELPAEETA